MDLSGLSLKLHREHHGKIATALRDPGPITREKLSAYYSPGVAAACEEIAAEPSETTATRLPVHVSSRRRAGSAAISSQAAATPGE